MERLRRIFILAVLLGLALFADPAAAQKDLPHALAPDILEGELWAADCLASPRANAECNRRALQEGKPGGLWMTAGRFTLLLVDGRVLRHSCPQLGRPATSLRAWGLLHKDGRAMSVVYLQALCGQQWQVVNLPSSGTEGSAAEVGNE